MVSYEENLEIKRREQRPSHSKIDTWNILPELPIQWLEEADTHGKLVPFGRNKKNFGVGCYQDGSVSCGFEIQTSDPQFLGEKEADELHRSLEAALVGLDRNDQIQFLWSALDEDETAIKIYEGERGTLKTHPIQSFTKKRIVERDQKRLQTGELKSYRCACFLNIPYRGKDEEFGAGVKEKRGFGEMLVGNFGHLSETITGWAKMVSMDTRAIEEEHTRERIATCVNKTKSLMGAFLSCPGLRVNQLDATEYYRILRRTWSPDQWRADKLREGGTMETLFGPLRYCLPSYVVLEDIDDRWGWTWKTGRFYHRILSMRVPPEWCDVGIMVGMMVAEENTAIYNSQYSLIIKPTSATKASAALHANLKLLRKQIEGNPQEHINLIPTITDMEEQIFKLSRSEGSHVFNTSLMVHIWHEDQEILDQWEAGLVRTFSIPPMKARLGCEEFNTLPYFLEKFTPGYTRGKDKHRDFVYLTREVATHIPLLGNSEGIVQVDPEGRRAPMLLETHRGTLMPQDDFARDRVNAWGGCGVGTTGSGKSMYYNLKIARTLSPKDIVIVLDGAVADGSYRSMCGLLGGAYIETGLELGEETFSQNPLLTEVLPDGSYRKPTTDELNRMTNNIEPMVRVRQTVDLTEPERASVSAAISLAFENYRDEKGRVYLRQVAKALRERNKGEKSSIAARSVDMGQHLEDQWCFPNGPYRFFVDRDSVPHKGNLTVYDLKGLGENPTLKGVMVATYLNQINVLVNENLKKRDEEQARIWVIIDEAWSALMDPTMVSSLMGLYRAGRARNISTHCLTQQMADFKKVLIASDRATGTTTFDANNNAILGNCTWFNLFKHDPDDVKVTQEVLNLPEEKAAQISKLGSRPGKYREMIQYVRLNNGAAFDKILVRPLPFELCAYTSDVKEKGRKESVRQEIAAEWKNPETRNIVRKTTIQQLEGMGFELARELRDEQLLEIQTVLETVRRKES
jgi:hypothetical protein